MDKMALEFEVKTKIGNRTKWLPSKMTFPSWQKAWNEAQILRKAGNVRNIKFKSVKKLKKVV